MKLWHQTYIISGGRDETHSHANYIITHTQILTEHSQNRGPHSKIKQPTWLYRQQETRGRDKEWHLCDEPAKQLLYEILPAWLVLQGTHALKVINSALQIELYIFVDLTTGTLAKVNSKHGRCQPGCPPVPV